VLGHRAHRRTSSGLLEDFDEALVTCDVAGRSVTANRRARDLPGALDAVRPLLHRALHGERIDGERLEAEGRSFDVAAWASGDAGAIAVLRERAGEEERRLQAAVLAHISEGIALIRAADGVLVYVNPARERKLGYAPGALVGEHVSRVHAPGEGTPQERADEMIGSLERDGEWRGELESMRADGTRFWSAAIVSRFDHGEHGTVWIAVYSDISRQTADELAIADAEERYRTVFEEGPVGIVVLAPGGEVMESNAAFSALTGYAHDELVGMTLDQLTAPEDRDTDADLARAVRSDELRRYRVIKRYVTKDGEIVPVAVTVTMVRDPGGRPLYELAIVEDASARRAVALFVSDG
jgi:PAS domain S-box-containing protein